MGLQDPHDQYGCLSGVHDAFDDAFSRSTTTQSRQDVCYTPFWTIQNPFLLICIVLLGWRSLCVSWDSTIRDVMIGIDIKTYAISICLKCRYNIFYGPLNQYATDKSKALSVRVLRESLVQRGEDKSFSIWINIIWRADRPVLTRVHLLPVPIHQFFLLASVARFVYGQNSVQCL
jgi:hypothetical protein